MSSTGQKFSVVLMVDMQPEPGHSSIQANYESRLKCVRSCCLKLLTYFSNKVSEDNFQWGFKFFNSVSSNIGDRWGFENFSLRNFELFESRLEEKFETECMKRESIHHSAAKLITSEYDNTPTTSKLSTGQCRSGMEDDDRSSQLKLALKAVCHDFPWEISDPNSSAKPTRSKDKRRSVKTEASNVNVLLVFSPCPHSMEDLRKFAECDGTNLKAILNSFMSEVIVKEFYEKRKIKLSWVDITAVRCENKLTKQLNNLEGLKTMNDVLRQIGGSIVMESALIRTGSLVTSLLVPLIEKYHKEASQNSTNSLGSSDQEADLLSCLALPTSSVMDTLCNNQLDTEHDAYLDLPCANFEPGGKMLERIEIHRLHMKQTSEEDEAPTEPTLHLTLPLDVPGAGGDGHACSDGMVRLHVGERVSKKFALRLQGQGCIPTKNLPLCALHSSAAYLVTSKGRSAQKFLEPLIAVLAQHQQVLVVECMDSVNQTPLTGILQPLTAVSATLTLVKTPFWPVLEKLMAFGQPTAPQTHPAHVRTFMERCAANILGQFKNNLSAGDTSAAPHCENRVPADSLASFNPSMMEQWCPAVLCNNDKFVDNLKCRSATTSREKENKDLLKCLRQFYKGNKNKTLGEKSYDQSTESSGLRRSPRKSPRKAYRLGKSPAKTANKALRKSPRKSTLLRKNSDKVVVMDRNRSFTAPASSRCTAIFQRSKSTLYDSPKKSEKGRNSNEKVDRKVNKTAVSVADFKDTPDMVQHILSLYQQTIDMKANALDCAQAMINIAQHYMQSRPAEEDYNPLEEVDKVVNDFILQSNNQLRDKYLDPQLANCDEMKSSEFELQILLPLELESLVRTENEELLESKVQQVVTKLRTLAFIKDTSYLNEFLSKTLLDNYVHTLPKVLVMIYEELLQPLPPQLEAFGEDDEMVSSVQPSSNASSCNTDPRSALSNDDLSSVRSFRSRRSVGSFPSFNQGSRRQIAIPGKCQGNNKILTRSAKKKAKKKQKNETKAEMKKVRRNLFDPVETGKKEPPKTPTRLSQRIASKDLTTTPKEYHILKTRKVEETPKHKQVRQALWRRQRTHTDSEVMVVQESPDKCLKAEKTDGPVRTPGRLIGGAKRKSFYSDAPDKQSRSMIRFKESRSVEASQSVQNRYNLLEARMSGRSPNKLTASQGAPVTSTSPRRIKPMCLFSHLMSPSPSKPLALRSTPGSARRRLDITAFDSPSKNTRSQNMFNVEEQAPEPAIQTPVKTLAFTPKKTAQFESLFAGRSRSMGTPVKTPRRIRATSISLQSSNPSNTPVKGILKTPKKQGLETPQKFHPAVASMSDLIMSPSRVTRQQVKTLFTLTDQPKSQAQRHIDLSRTSTLVSNNSVRWEDECEASDQYTEADDSVFINPGETGHSTSPPQNLFMTPSKQYTASVKVPQTPTQSSEKSGKENCLTPKDGRKKVKTPDSLDKWPRRKRRNTMNSPPQKVDSLPASPEQSDSKLKERLAEGDIISCDKECNKVAVTPSKNVRTVSSSCFSPMKGQSSNWTPKKRKRNSPTGKNAMDILTDNVLPNSPFKRCKLSALEARMTSSQGSTTDYFDSTDVFISDSEPVQKVSNRHLNRVISGGSDGASVLSSEAPSSPVFPMATHILTRHGSSHEQELLSDQDSQGSLSPVFRRKMSSLIDNLDSDTESSPKKPSVPTSPVVGSPRVNYRKFSPNVSAKSLSHLMMSPLISEKSVKSNEMPDSPQRTVRQNRPSSPSAKNSRRSLYKSRP